MTPPTSRIALVAPEAWPASCGRTLASTALALGREDQRHAGAGEHERRDELERTARRRADDRASQAMRDRLQREAGAISGREPIRSLSSARRSARRTSACRSTAASAARPRAARVALRGLEELAEQEDRAEGPEEHRERHAVGGARSRASGRTAAAASAPARARSQARKAASSATPAPERARARSRSSSRAPGRARCRTSRPSRPTPASARPGRSRRSVGPVRLVEHARARAGSARGRRAR